MSDNNVLEQDENSIDKINLELSQFKIFLFCFKENSIPSQETQIFNFDSCFYKFLLQKENIQLKSKFIDEFSINFISYLSSFTLEDLLLMSIENEKEEGYFEDSNLLLSSITFLFRNITENEIHKRTNWIFQKSKEIKEKYLISEKKVCSIPKVNLKNLKISSLFNEIKKSASKILRNNMKESLENNVGVSMDKVYKLRKAYKNPLKYIKKNVAKETNNLNKKMGNVCGNINSNNQSTLNKNTLESSDFNTGNSYNIPNSVQSDNDENKIKFNNLEIDSENNKDLNENRSYYKRLFDMVLGNNNKIKQEEIKISSEEYIDFLERIFNKLKEDQLMYMVYRKGALPFFETKLYLYEEDLNKGEISKKEYEFKVFSLFIIFFYSTITYFTNLNGRIYLDEIDNIGIDFFLSDFKIKKLAAELNYQIHLKIKNYDEGKGVFKEDNRKEKLFNSDYLKQVNYLPIEVTLSKTKLSPINNISQYDDPNLHPPCNEYINEVVFYKYYRQYDRNDNLYDDYIEFNQSSNYSLANNFNYKNLDNKKNESNQSFFRFIDKTRFAIYELNKVLSIEGLNEYYLKEDDSTFKKLLKRHYINHNFNSFNKEYSIENLIKTYLSIEMDEKVLILNGKFRNLLGEEIGFYFLWISHLIHYLHFPAVIGVFIVISFFILNIIFPIEFLYENYIDFIFQIPFTIFIIYWSKSYSESWIDIEKVYIYKWGMEDQQDFDMLTSDFSLADNYNINEDNEEEEEEENNHKENINEIEKSNKTIKVNKKTKLIYEKFLNLKLPVQMKDNFKTIASYLITFLLLLLVIVSNNSVFYLENFINSNFKNIINRVSSNLLLYIYPFSLYIIRQINTFIYYYVTEKMTSIENNNQSESSKRQSLLVKSVLFQIFNYYYNLYYILFIKSNSPEKCYLSNCKLDLERQVIVILLSSILNDVISSLLIIIFNKERLIRKTYDYTNADMEFIDIMLNFGYVIQFGGSSPICFVLCLFLTIISRLTDSLRFSYYEHVNFVSLSKGIGSFGTILNVLVTLGVIINLSVNLICDNRIRSLFNIEYRIGFLVCCEMIIVIILIFTEMSKLPIWFKYRNEIKGEIIKKINMDY